MRLAVFCIVFISGVMAALFTSAAAEPWLAARRDEARRSADGAPPNPDHEFMDSMRTAYPTPASGVPFVARGRLGASGFVPARGGRWSALALPYARITIREARRGERLPDAIRSALVDQVKEIYKQRWQCEAELVQRENELVDAWESGRRGDDAKRPVGYFVTDHGVFVLHEGDDAAYDELWTSRSELDAEAQTVLDVAFEHASK
jgi:hypothetical protein